MAALANPFTWLAAVAFAALVAAAGKYMGAANALCRRVDAVEPELWTRLLIWNWAKKNNPYMPGRAGRVETLVVWGMYFEPLPADAEFRRCLSLARRWAFACLVCWVAGLFFLAETGLRFPHVR